MVVRRRYARLDAVRSAGRHCKKAFAGLLLVALTAACSSVDQVGMMALPSASPASLLTTPTAFQTLGAAQGEACRYFALGVIPWGNSTAGRALERALAPTGGNALLNASVETSLFGFIPIYNIFSYTCTTVRGVAIKYEPTGNVNQPSVAPPS